MSTCTLNAGTALHEKWFYGSASLPQWASGFRLIQEKGARFYLISLVFWLKHFNWWIKSVSFTELYFTVQSHTNWGHPTLASSGAFGTRQRWFSDRRVCVCALVSRPGVSEGFVFVCWACTLAKHTEHLSPPPTSLNLLFLFVFDLMGSVGHPTPPSVWPAGFLDAFFFFKEKNLCYQF